MFWLFLFVLALMATLYWAWKFGLLDKFSMEKGRLMSCEILYLPYKGDYHKLGPLFEQVSRNTQTVFKFSQNFGFYYDDPGTTAAQNCRAIVGIIVNEGEQFKMGQFCRNFEGYRRAHLETTRYISHEMPFVNMLSIVLMVKRVYPRIQEYLKKEDIKEQELFGMMEIYRCVSSQKKIEIAVPLNNKEQFFGLIEDRLRDDEQSHG